MEGVNTGDAFITDGEKGIYLNGNLHGCFIRPVNINDFEEADYYISDCRHSDMQLQRYINDRVKNPRRAINTTSINLCNVLGLNEGFDWRLEDEDVEFKTKSNVYKHINGVLHYANIVGNNDFKKSANSLRQVKRFLGYEENPNMNKSETTYQVKLDDGKWHDVELFNEAEHVFYFHKPISTPLPTPPAPPMPAPYWETTFLAFPRGSDHIRVKEVTKIEKESPDVIEAYMVVIKNPS